MNVGRSYSPEPVKTVTKHRTFNIQHPTEPVGLSMEASPSTPPPPWQPLTFRSVAAFAHARLGRLLFVQLIVALVSAAVIVLCFQLAWDPSIREAIEQLPAQGEIREGKLHWAAPAPQRLGKGSFVSFVIDPGSTGDLGEAADVEWVFTLTELRLRSLFGYTHVPYPSGLILSFNHPELKPWWGAWRPAVLAVIAALVVAALLAMWWMLSAVYAFPVRLIAFYADGQITSKGAWQLAGAAVLPGALFMDLALLAYAFHRLNFLQLLGAAGAHFVVGGIFAIVAPMRLRKLTGGTSARSKNPFATPSSTRSMSDPEK